MAIAGRFVGVELQGLCGVGASERPGGERELAPAVAIVPKKKKPPF